MAVAQLQEQPPGAVKCFCLFWRCWCSLGISIQPLLHPAPLFSQHCSPNGHHSGSGPPALGKDPSSSSSSSSPSCPFPVAVLQMVGAIPVVTVAPELRSEVANLQVKCYFFLAAEVKGSNLSLMKTPDPGLLGLGGKSGSSAECFGSQFLWEGLSDWWLRLKQSLEEVIRVILSRSPQLWRGVTSPSPAATPSPFCVN